MKSLCATSHWKRAALLVVVLLCLAAGFILLRPSSPAPVVVLSRPYLTPSLMRDRLVRWVPATASWAWVPRLEDAILGRRKPVNIFADVVALPHSGRTAIALLPPNATTYSNASGLRLSFIRAEELKSLRERLKQTPGASFVSHPRISTADGIGATLFVGQAVPLNGRTNHVGLSLDCYPLVHRRSTDLFTAVMFSEIITNDAISAGGAIAPTVSVRTNLDLAARLQVPKGHGVLFFRASPGEGIDKTFGLLIDPL
ncbi:MAG TPA: hypothetical protein VJA21_01955 [Verrucomicrobiae bacterium]